MNDGHSGKADELRARPSKLLHRLIICPLAAAGLIWLSGCANLAGPEYQRPEVARKDQWSQLHGRELSASEVISPDWWTAFGDPYLNQLISTAINDGLDLDIAAARLRKAAIEGRRSRFALTPEINVSPTGTLQQSRIAGSSVQKGSDTELLGATLNWELDLWGKIRKEVQAQDASYKATEMDWRAAYLTLVADVAQQYFQIRLFDEQIHQQNATRAKSEALLRIYQAQYREGLIAQTTVLNQESEINGLSKQLLELQRGRMEAQLRLATLLGLPAGELIVPVRLLRQSVQLVDAPLLLPGDLLARRPDVLRAEYELLQAHHLVGKARLARLPTLSLAATANSGNNLTGVLLDSWTAALTASLGSLFDRNLAIDVPLNEAEVEVRKTQYRQVVLRAFEEVEIALLNLRSRKQQMHELQRQIDNLEIVRGVQQARLREGLVSQLEVFETERTLLNAQLGIINEYQASLNDTVNLYKALGGGWPPEVFGTVTGTAATIQQARIRN